MTISTVGYGDQYPVTDAGRILGALIIVVGVGIFGTFTGYLANFFLAPRRKKANEGNEPASDPQLMLEHLKLLIAQQETKVGDVDGATARIAEDGRERRRLIPGVGRTHDVGYSSLGVRPRPRFDTSMATTVTR